MTSSVAKARHRRTVWTPEENNAIVRYILDKHGTGELPKPFFHYVTEAQEAGVVSLNRRRPTPTMDSVGRVLAAYNEQRRVQVLTKAAAPTQPPAVLNGTPVALPVAPPVAPQSETLAQPAPAPDLSYALQRAQDVASTWLADVLVEAARKFITHPEVARGLYRLQMGALPEAAIAEGSKHKPEPQGEERKRTPSVLVCGFKPHEQAKFQATFPNLHIKFWYDGGQGGGAGIRSLEDKVRGADAVFFTMEATSHAHVGIAQRLGKELHRVTGGASSMLTELNTYATRAGAL